MDLDQALYARRSVRAFTDQPVERAVLLRLIDAAAQAPSAMNEQPWLFAVVQHPGLLARISQASKAHFLQVSADETAALRLRELLTNPQFDIFYGAPALIVIASTYAGRWAAENCALAAENLMLAACAAGLGTCWIGFAQSWLATQEGKAALGLPATCLPVAPLIVGYPREMAAAAPRRRPQVHWPDERALTPVVSATTAPDTSG